MPADNPDEYSGKQKQYYKMVEKEIQKAQLIPQEQDDNYHHPKKFLCDLGKFRGYGKTVRISDLVEYLNLPCEHGPHNGHVHIYYVLVLPEIAVKAGKVTSNYKHQQRHKGQPGKLEIEANEASFTLPLGKLGIKTKGCTQCKKRHQLRKKVGEITEITISLRTQPARNKCLGHQGEDKPDQISGQLSNISFF